MGIFRKKEKPGLVEKYIIWRQRVEDLEAERPAIYAGLLQLEQAAMEGGPVDPQDLQVSRQKLADHDRKLEAAAAKVSALWEQLETSAAANIAARRQAAPQVEAELRQEFEEGCALAGAVFASAMTLAENLGIHRASVAKALGFPSGGIVAGAGQDNCPPLAEGFGRAKGRPLEPKDPEWCTTYRGRENDHLNFMLSTAYHDGRQNYIRQQINKAIREAGGTPPLPNHGIEGGVIHGKAV
jgi:hypothetical protein